MAPKKNIKEPVVKKVPAVKKVVKRVTKKGETKTIDERWAEITNGMKYKEMFLKYTKEYRDAGLVLKNEVGEAKALGETIKGMKAIGSGVAGGNIQSGDACAKLSNLIKLSDILMNQKKVPSKLLNETKFKFYEQYETNNNNNNNNNNNSNRTPITPGLV